jgi:hypothetical protein
MMEHMANPEYVSDETDSEPSPSERRSFMYLMKDRTDTTTDPADVDSGESWLDRLQHDLDNVSDLELAEHHVGDHEDVSSAAGSINYAALEFEIERMRKRIAIWEILMVHMKAGAETWTEIQQALTPADCDRIIAICDGGPLGELLYLQ